MPPTLRLLVSSGEPLPLRLLRGLQASLPQHATVLNLYGSTETAADCTCCNATDWLQVNASRLTPPAATSSTCSPATERFAFQPEGEVSEQGSSGVASEHGEHVPVGWPLDNMAVFIAVPMGEGHEDDSRSGNGAGGCMKASDVLDWGSVGEVCVMGAGICAGYLRCYIPASGA